MSTITWVVVAAVVIAAVAGCGFLLWTRARTQRLRRRFGPEYDRALEQHQSRRAAERELLARTEHHRTLDIRPLDPEAREGYRGQWTRLQERFVDEPVTAVAEADRLLTTVMSERGYPTSGYEERVATLSVEHGRALDQYRRGHEIGVRAGRQEASTEDLRQAMVHYRALFEDLLAVPDPDSDSAPASHGAHVSGADRNARPRAAADAGVNARSDGEQPPRPTPMPMPEQEQAQAHERQQPDREPSTRNSATGSGPQVRQDPTNHPRS